MRLPHMSHTTLLAREGLLKKINLGLLALQLNVDGLNHLRLFDVNTVSEDFFAVFLSRVYGLSLVNLNIVCQNYPAIDLGDTSKKHSIQITSDGSKPKVKETIEKFLEHGLQKKFTRLQIVIIGKRSGKYAGLARSKSPKLDTTSDIKGVPELLTDIKKLDTQDLQSLSDIIDREMPIMKAFAGQAKPTDEHALHEIRAHFDRPALQDPWDVERSFSGFGIALDDLISLLNTGVVKGAPVTKRRTDFDDAHFRDALENLYHKVRSLRVLYTAHVKSGEINEKTNMCRFRDQRTYHVFDEYKQVIVDELNALLHKANMQPIHGVSRRHW
jgi:hypothetical protein